MQKLNHTFYDVAVIGGGMAGLSAGLTLSRAGISVAIFEKKKEIGSLIRCGELARHYIFTLLKINKTNRFIQRDYKKDDLCLIFKDRFEKHLASEIENNKGDVYTNTCVKNCITIDDNVQLNVNINGKLIYHPTKTWKITLMKQKD